MRALAALLCLLAVPAAAQVRSTTAQAPLPSEVVDLFHDALRTGDRRKALEQLTADVLIFEQGRRERSRTEYARSHLAEDIGFASVTTRTVAHRTVKQQGGVAWVTSLNRTRGTFKARAVDFVTEETMVLVQTGGKWRIAHIHWSFDDSESH